MSPAPEEKPDRRANIAHRANIAQIVSAIVGTILGILALIVAIIGLHPTSSEPNSASNDASSSTTMTTPPPPATTTLSTAPTTTATLAPTALPVAYTTDAPGLGCDTNGGAWNSRGLDGLTCTSSGTQLIINVGGTQGYLYLQGLPHDQAFAPNNTIAVASILGGIASGYQTKCVGLGELGASGGYDAEYCNDGNWFTAATGSEGVTITKQHRGVAAMLTSAAISLTLKNKVISFSINNSVVDTLPVSAVTPTKIAIVYNCVGYGAEQTIGGNYLTIQSFSYAPS